MGANIEQVLGRGPFAFQAYNLLYRSMFSQRIALNAVGFFSICVLHVSGANYGTSGAVQGRR